MASPIQLYFANALFRFACFATPTVSLRNRSEFKRAVRQSGVSLQDGGGPSRRFSCRRTHQSFQSKGTLLTKQTGHDREAQNRRSRNLRTNPLVPGERRYGRPSGNRAAWHGNCRTLGCLKSAVVCMPRPEASHSLLELVEQHPGTCGPHQLSCAPRLQGAAGCTEHAFCH